MLLLLFCGLTLVAQAQVEDQDSTGEDEEEFLFEDTLGTVAPMLLVAEGPGDSTAMLPAQVTDSLLNLPPNLIPKVSMDLLKDRLACIEGQIPLTLNPKVASFIDYFVVRNRAYTKMVLERKDFYFPIFEKYLKQYGLPDELKYLAIVESGLKYNAVSRVGAVGLWQFMPVTGKECGLALDYYHDERMEVEKATEAACKYLKRLYRVLGDWELVLASYNCGVGKVKRTVERTGLRRFWDVYNHLPQETRAYVPQFVALTYAVNYHKEHNIFPDADSLLTLPEADTVLVNKQVSIPALAGILGVPDHQLRLMNATYRRLTTPSDKPAVVRIPKETKKFFALNRSEILDSASVPVPEEMLPYYVVKDGRRMMGKLLASNGRPSKSGRNKRDRRSQPETQLAMASASTSAVSNITAVRTLAGPTDSPELPQGFALAGSDRGSDQGKEAKDNRDGKSETKSADVETGLEETPTQHIHKVEPGQGLYSIARMYGVTIDQLCDWNGLDKDKALVRGQELKIMSVDDAHDTALADAKSTKGTKESKSAKAARKLKEQQAKFHLVQPGDTLWAISQKYEGLTIDDIIRLNRLKNRKLTPGQKLIVG